MSEPYSHETEQETYARLQHSLDELVACFIGQTRRHVSEATVMELLMWSSYKAGHVQPSPEELARWEPKRPTGPQPKGAPNG
jgi:hypothetical protein